jgi:hypothetical protein
MEYNFVKDKVSLNLVNSIGMFSSIIKDATNFITRGTETKMRTEKTDNYFSTLQTEHPETNFNFYSPISKTPSIPDSNKLHLSDEEISKYNCEKELLKLDMLNSEQLVMSSYQNFKYKKEKGARHKKILWRRREELCLIELVEKYGENFEIISHHLHGRSVQEIKEKYFLKLNPNLSKDKFTSEEDDKIIFLHKKYGNHWNIIAKYFPNRNSNNIKNRFYSFLRNKCFAVNSNALPMEALQKIYSSNLINKHDNNNRFLNINHFFQNAQSKIYFENINLKLLESECDEKNKKNYFHYNDDLQNVNFKNEDFCFKNKDFDGTENFETSASLINSYHENDCEDTEYKFLIYKYEVLQNTIKKILNSSAVSETYQDTNNSRTQEYFEKNIFSKLENGGSENIENLYEKLNQFQQTKGLNLQIPKENLIKVIDLMLQLIKLLKSKIEKC